MNKTLLTIISLIFVASTCMVSCNNHNANNEINTNNIQNSDVIKLKNEDINKDSLDKRVNNEPVFTAAEQMPQFPGGDAELMKYISSHLHYPQAAIDKKAQGRVIIQLVIRTDGTIGDVKVVRSVDTDLDNEAVRICKSLPKFIPGKMNEKVVNTWYTIPITFKINE